MMMAIIYQSHSIHLVYKINVKGTGSEATGDKYNKKKARPLQANKMFSFSNMNSSISILSCRLSFWPGFPLLS